MLKCILTGSYLSLIVCLEENLVVASFDHDFKFGSSYETAMHTDLDFEILANSIMLNLGMFVINLNLKFHSPVHLLNIVVYRDS